MTSTVDPDPFARALARVAGPPTVEGVTFDEVLGDGAQCRVWGARDAVGRRLAVKALVDASPTGRERLEREAAVLRRLQGCVSLVTLVRLLRDAHGAPCLLLDRIEGDTLASILATTGPMTPRAAATLGGSLARALALAHARGVVHRDVKPANVMIEKATGRPVLIDFGVARLLGAAPLTQVGARPGTPAYMPPERLRGADLGAEVDVYALGVLLFECVTGTRPWEDGGVYERLARDPWAEPPATARMAARRVPGRFRRIVADCLAGDPRRRVRDAASLADRLERFAAESAGARGWRVGRLGLALSLALSATGVTRDGPRHVPATAVHAVDRGREWLQAGDAAAALAACDSAIAIAPTYPPAWVLRGTARLRSNDPQGAVRELNRALTLAPSDPAAWILRARARLAIADARGALEDCGAAIALAPDFAEAYQVRGLAEYQLARRDVGDMRRARADFTRAIALDPTNADTYCYRGFTRHFLGDPAGAIEDHSSALRLQPDHMKALLNRGAVRVEVGDHASAIADLDRVMPEDPYALLYRGRARLGLGDEAGALADWSEFIARFPETQDARQLASEVHDLRQRLQRG